MRRSEHSDSHTFGERFDLFLDELRSRLSDLDKGKVSQLVSELRSTALREIENGVHVAVIGKTGVGKTTTINNLFGVDMHVSHVAAATKSAQTVDLRSDTGLLRVTDLPGFGEDLDSDTANKAMWTEALLRADVALLVLKADDRAMAGVQQFMRDVAPREAAKRIIVAINQVDLVQPGQWLDGPNLPSPQQELSIANIVKERARSIDKVRKLEASQIIAYSALKRYRLQELFESMIRHTAGEAWVLNELGDVADYRELVDPVYLGDRAPYDE